MKKIHILEATMDYDGSYIIGLYESEDMAIRKKERIEASNASHQKRWERWQDVTDDEQDPEKWPDSPESPEHYGYDISVNSRNVTPMKK